jgi:hypothetical protein
MEYSDGYRAVYQVDPARIGEVLNALATVPTKATWVAVTIRGHRTHRATVQAAVGMVTPARPPLQPVPGLIGLHGLHRDAAQALSIYGLNLQSADDAADVDDTALQALRWPTTAHGVPIGYDRTRDPVYVGLTSPEPVRITVTGTPDFHVQITAKLALSGLPIVVYTRDPRRWNALANHGAPEQILVNPVPVTTGAIVVSDGSLDAPPAPVSVALRHPQPTPPPPPPTTIVITQDPRRRELFTITTPAGTRWLSITL